MVTRIIFFLIFALYGFVSFSCSKNEQFSLPDRHYEGNSGWLVDTNKMTGTQIMNVFPLVTEPIYSSAVGAHSGNSPQFINSFETTYGTALKYFQDALVFTDFEGSDAYRSGNVSKSLPRSNDLVLGFPEHTIKPGLFSAINFSNLFEKGVVEY